MKIRDKVRIRPDLKGSRIFLSKEGMADSYIVTDVFISCTGNPHLNGESSSGRLVGGPVSSFELLERSS